VKRRFSEIEKRSTDTHPHCPLDTTTVHCVFTCRPSLRLALKIRSPSCFTSWATQRLDCQMLAPRLLSCHLSPDPRSSTSFSTHGSANTSTMPYCSNPALTFMPKGSCSCSSYCSSSNNCASVSSTCNKSICSTTLSARITSTSTTTRSSSSSSSNTARAWPTCTPSLSSLTTKYVRGLTQMWSCRCLG